MTLTYYFYFILLKIVTSGRDVTQGLRVLSLKTRARRLSDSSRKF